MALETILAPVATKATKVIVPSSPCLKPSLFTTHEPLKSVTKKGERVDAVVWELVESVAELTKEVVVGKSLLVLNWEVYEVEVRTLLEVVDKALVVVVNEVTVIEVVTKVDRAVVVVVAASVVAVAVVFVVVVEVATKILVIMKHYLEK